MPTDAGQESIGFTERLGVEVREIDDESWMVLQAFRYQAIRESYCVPAGEKTDFASVPRPFVWFIPAYGRYTKAAILHDHLCELARHGQFNRRDADGVFRQAMRSSGVPFLRRWIMWAAVRWGALASREGRKDWWRDAWRVVPLTLLVFPIIAPAALLIVMTLIVWHVAELLMWVPLALVGHVKAKARTPRKQVNRPTLTFRL